MRYFFFTAITLLLLIAMANNTQPVSIYDFRKGTSATDWKVQDDVVMGGRSDSQVAIDDEGHAHFHGHVSLENDGGFASILHTLSTPVDVSGLDHFTVRLKGDGKNYTLRVKTDPANQYYFESAFPTSGEWETIEVSFAKMKPVHHGEPVDVPNFSGDKVTKVQFLIGNGEEEDFTVFIDRIEAG